MKGPERAYGVYERFGKVNKEGVSDQTSIFALQIPPDFGTESVTRSSLSLFSRR